jgi:hypothetical protein
VGNPTIRDDKYHAQKCYDLANDHGTRRASRNADSYTLDALAIYVQQHWQTHIPPAPEEWIEDYMPASDPDWANMKRLGPSDRERAADK